MVIREICNLLNLNRLCTNEMIDKYSANKIIAKNTSRFGKCLLLGF